MEEQLWHKHKWPPEVPHSLTYEPQPLFKVLEETAQKYPNRPYTIFADHEQTYRQILDMAERVATFLVQKGIQRGDRVALFLPNVPHFPVTFFGALKSGAVCVTCNPLYKANELNFQLKDCGAKALFVLDHPVIYPTALEALKGTDVQTVVVCSVKDFLPPLKAVLGGLLGKIPKAPALDPKHLLFKEVLKTPPSPPKLEINPVEDLALILYTGGTTGVPKGASLTHNNIYSNMMMIDEWGRLETKEGGPAVKVSDTEQTFMGVLPWYHSYGLTLTLLTCCAGGYRVVCVPDPRAGNPPFTEVLKLIQKYKVTILHGVPTLYSAIINHPLVSQFDLSSIIYCSSGAAPLPLEVAKKFEELTKGGLLVEGYGLSETSPVTHTNPTNRRGRKFGTIGLPLPDTMVKILDAETGDKEMAQGEDGEIALSGPQVMKGYWNKPEENEKVFRMIEDRRYFLTGDIGHLDEEGFTVITDRKKDMIIVGGMKAFPREVEEVLYEHPKVANAAVIGIPDPRSGESVKAFVQLKAGETATEEEIIEFCRDRMAAYKRPHAVEFREALPMTPVGKILRRVLKDEEKQKRQAQ